MRCPHCQINNRKTANYCSNCGHKLERICSACGNHAVLDSQYCDKCGHDLSAPIEGVPRDLSFAEKLAKLQCYLPEGITEKVLTQRGKIEGERKQITVMFCDMMGFTALVEKKGPEEAYAMMDQIYEILIRTIHNFQGTVNEMTGDGVMGLFGAPISIENAPQRAIQAAVSIHREMALVNDQQKIKGLESPIKMRIGINSGTVIVGTLGNDLRVEFKAVGDTVNLASRMENMAEPGTTYVTEETFKKAEGLFQFESLGAREIKGKEKPIRMYRVIAPGTRSTRFEVNTDRGLTPFTGRQKELELLLDGFARVKRGRGEAFSIVAEAGSGKTRLLYEFRKAIASEDVTIREGRCFSHIRHEAYHPIIEMLKVNFAIKEDDSFAGIKEKVSRGLELLQIESKSTLAYILELFSRNNGSVQEIISAEEKRNRIMNALKRIVFKGSELRPVIIAVEDLNWIDKSSEEVLKDLFDNIGGSRILLILTYRPTFELIWGTKSYQNQINLNRLSERESLQMVYHLLGTDKIAMEVEDLILNKTEGIPLFIEELCKSLMDLKIIYKIDDTYYLKKDNKDLDISTTLQEIITARVDMLPERSKEILQIASVIAREFSHELLRHVTGLPEKELVTDIGILKDAELIYEKGIFPQSSYFFKHALTRQVVYDSILSKKRRNLHEKIGHTIEAMFREHISDHYTALAHHYLESGNYEKGSEYSRLAARKAENASSFTEAIAHTERRIAALEKLPYSDENQKKIADARISLGIYLFPLNYLVEAKAAIDPVYEFVLKKSYRKKQSLVFTILGTYHFMIEENFQKAFITLQKALEIAEEIGDIFSANYANMILGTALSWDCQFERATDYLEKTISVVADFKLLWSLSVMKCGLSFYVYNYQGMTKKGYETSLEALRIALESGDILPEAMAYATHGISCYFMGELDDAERHLIKGAGLCERIKLFSFCSIAYQYLGFTLFCKKKYPESLEAYQKAIFFREINKLVPSTITLNRLALARSLAVMNREINDLNLLKLCASENRIRIYEGSMARFIAEILMHQDGQSPSDVESWINKAIEIDRQNGMIWHLGQDYMLSAYFFLRHNESSKARNNFMQAMSLFRECEAEGWVRLVNEELDNNTLKPKVKRRKYYGGTSAAE